MENEPFFEDILKALRENLPEHVSLGKNLFLFDQEKILEEAESEGYTILLGKYRIETDADKDHYVICNDRAINFLSRIYFKGKPGREFRLNRAGDKPASYSDKIIAYYQQGNLHRTGDRPAYLSFENVSWCRDGKWHRDDDGPSDICANHIGWHKNHDLIFREVYIPEIGRQKQKFVGFVDGIGRWENV